MAKAKAVSKLSEYEQETIIVLNLGEQKREKFFRFCTSREKHFELLCKKVGGRANLMEVRIDRNVAGQITEWQCKVPMKYLSPSNLGIRSEFKGKSNLPAASTAANPTTLKERFVEADD